MAPGMAITFTYPELDEIHAAAYRAGMSIPEGQGRDPVEILSLAGLQATFPPRQAQYSAISVIKRISAGTLMGASGFKIVSVQQSAISKTKDLSNRGDNA
jgi:hypothetical protein